MCMIFVKELIALVIVKTFSMDVFRKCPFFEVDNYSDILGSIVEHLFLQLLDTL